MGIKIPFQLNLGEERIVRADWFPADASPLGTIIVLHGYKGFKDYGMFPAIGTGLSDQWDVITFNFSHNGVGESLTEFTELEKFARNTYSLEQEDLLALVKAVRGGTLPLGSGYDTRPMQWPIYLHGHSKGGGASLLFALDHPDLISGVISWNGTSSLQSLYSEAEKAAMMAEGRAYTMNARTKQQMPLDRVLLEDLERNKERFDLIGRIGSLRVPAVLIQGEKDGAHLMKGSARLVEAQPELRRHLVPDGDHRFNTVHPYEGDTKPFVEALRLTKLWLSDQTGEV
jgi:pimeloyl-ACP methyl ester carboxylesterase